MAQELFSKSESNKTIRRYKKLKRRNSNCDVAKYKGISWKSCNGIHDLMKIKAEKEKNQNQQEE